MNNYERAARSSEIISYYTGYVVLGTALLMFVPILTAILSHEWMPMLDFLITLGITVSVGCLLTMLGRRARYHSEHVQWKHGFAIAALSWITLTLLCAIPYRLSGNSLSFLDSCFDVMSGFTTTGLALTQDLDHLSNALNMWRHMLTFIGGQGMVVLALTFIVKEGRGSYMLYVGEAKDIELVPNVKGTARIIWKISLIYLLLGTFVLWICGMIIGLSPASSFLHGLYMYESAWSTGGFAPNTQNVMFYHSFLYESVLIVFFIIGSFNFGLHYAIWQGKRREALRNIETQSFAITSFVATAIAVAVLAQTNMYSDAISLFRRVVFNVLSAHTTTGFGSVYARQFASEWGAAGVIILIIAMLIGGSACSTAGGFKGLRVGVLFKGFIREISKLLYSERSTKVYKYHHIKDIVLEDGAIRASAIIVILYLVLFSGGTLLGALCGYSLTDAAFESASVTGNVGLSIGVTSASMPTVMKLYYIVAMYLGRLEFLSVFALIGMALRGAYLLCKKHRP